VNNLISQCFVVFDASNVEPVIYLKEPEFDPVNEAIRTFTNPFEAKNFIKLYCPYVEKIIVTNGETTTRKLAQGL
jgi:hypothetical protein